MKKTALALILATASVIGLGGCTAVADALHHEASYEFEDTATMAGNWNTAADWVPDDGTAIRVHETVGGGPAILAVRSARSLDPALCSETTRKSAPVFAASWAPDPFEDSVWACGAWAVIPTDHGWFGWTPNDPDEQAAAPESSGRAGLH